MSPAQERWLGQAHKADGPIRIPTSTAHVLFGYGLLDPVGDLWRITDKGCDRIGREQRQAAYSEADQALTREARAWADRVFYWLKAHERLWGSDYQGPYRYARHVAASDFDGVFPARPVGTWEAKALTRVLERTREAAKLIRAYDDAKARANARGTSIEVGYDAAPKVPRSPREAARQATEADNTISLTSYREHRPSRTRPRRPAGDAA